MVPEGSYSLFPMPGRSTWQSSRSELNERPVGYSAFSSRLLRLATSSSDTTDAHVPHPNPISDLFYRLCPCRLYTCMHAARESHIPKASMNEPGTKLHYRHLPRLQKNPRHSLLTVDFTPCSFMIALHPTSTRASASSSISNLKIWSMDQLPCLAGRQAKLSTYLSSALRVEAIPDRPSRPRQLRQPHPFPLCFRVLSLSRKHDSRHS